MSPYEVLGVPVGSSNAVCKKAYRALCIKYHPDNGGDASKYQEVCRAYEQTKNVGIKKRRIVHVSLFTYKVEEY